MDISPAHFSKKIKMYNFFAIVNVFFSFSSIAKQNSIDQGCSLLFFVSIIWSERVVQETVPDGVGLWARFGIDFGREN